MANKTSPTEITLTYAKQILRVCKLHLQQHKIYASNVYGPTLNWDQKKITWPKVNWQNATSLFHHIRQVAARVAKVVVWVHLRPRFGEGRSNIDGTITKSDGSFL